MISSKKLKFYSYKLFLSQKTIKISYLEIAQFLGVSERTAKRYIKRDMENGFLTKEYTQYKCRKYKTLLSGRNIYHLTDKGKFYISSNELDMTPPSVKKKKNSSKEEFAMGKTRKTFLKKRKKIFEKYQLGHLFPYAPYWWFKNPSILEKTLKLLRNKKKKNYHVKNEFRWISTVIRDGGRGFRYKIAKKTSLVLANNRKSVWQILQSSDKVLSDFDRLKELKKRGLNTSFAEMQKLLRKGFSHLASCVEVLLKLLQYQSVRKINGFLHWLVSCKEPFDVFKKKFTPPHEVVDWAKNLFTKEHKKCFFDEGEEFEKWSRDKQRLDRKKLFVRFRIFKEKEKSFVSLLFYQEKTGWKEKFLKVVDPFFKNEMLQVFQLIN